jgi:single-strand DNA-binding protein
MVNKVLLIGRLGKDPEVRYIPDGTMVTSFSIATDESWKNKDGQKVQRTEWHRIEAWGKLAEICGNYLVKGKLVYIEGKIKTQAWEDKEGVKRYTTKIQAANMKMLDGKQEGVSDTQTHSQDAGQVTHDGEVVDAIPEDDVPF